MACGDAAPIPPWLLPGVARGEHSKPGLVPGAAAGTGRFRHGSHRSELDKKIKLLNKKLVQLV
jgi:hypothetical protein